MEAKRMALSEQKVRDVHLGSLRAALRHAEDGSLYVTCLEPMPAVRRCLTDNLDHWAKVAPDRIYLAERDEAGAWRKVTYAQALSQVQHVASSLLERDLSPDKPIVILSGNDIAQAILSLAALYVGIPFAPVSPAYSLISTDHAKLKNIINALDPGLVFVSHAKPFEKAIAATCKSAVEIVALNGTLIDRPTTAFSSLLQASISSQLKEANSAVGPDTIAKILFTSGSTGEPKGVINTQSMLTTNQAMMTHWLAFAKEQPPVLVDWLPWHHTFGGNHNFGHVLTNGGSLYIDGGKPTPQGIDETVRNLSEIAPTIYFNVPKGFEELLLKFRENKQLRETFFSRVKLNLYAGAGLPLHVARGIDEIAVETVGERILMITSLGSTETAPAALSCTKETARPGVVGVPLPGVELKLVPSGDKLELRIKGPNIMPGYWKLPEQTAKSFDDEGFYCIGDALKFAIPGDPNGGFIFDGRVSEDFKLVTGTWVSVGPLRGKLIAALAPFIKDAVIAGHDRNDITAMLFPELAACRAFLGDAATGLSDAEVLASPALRAAISEKLRIMQKESTGSSTRVSRVTLLVDLPSIDANEITDKGSINQRAVLARRSAIVESLYQTPSPTHVIPSHVITA
jgi:feruloyl-CoA synthase